MQDDGCKHQAGFGIKGGLTEEPLRPTLRSYEEAHLVSSPADQIGWEHQLALLSRG